MYTALLNKASKRFSKRRLISDAKRFIAYLDALSARIAPPDEDIYNNPANLAAGTIKLGVYIVIAVFGVFGLWAVAAPIDSAAVAPGQVVLDSNKKSIQHLEGGIVEKIMVKEGEQVRAGQELIRLNETASKARLDMFRSQFIAARASEARLLAERDGKDKVTFPEDLLKITHEGLSDIVDSQKRLFESRGQALQGQIDVLGQKEAQYRQEIEGLRAQEAAAASQIKLLDEEISAVRTLLKQGLAVKPRLLALERAGAELQGKRGESLALISRAEQSIGETQLAIINKKNDFINDVVKELKDTQIQLADLEERIRASADIMDRVIIVSPVSGKVTALKVHTVGGVINPGETIMDIVPSDDMLIIESKVSPQDIDVVRKDLTANVRLTAYKSRTVPPVEGRVIDVSADKFVDPRMGSEYYIARVEINKQKLGELDDVELTPGMPADVLIVTGERTLISYLLAPIKESVRHAFRED